jgi:hypothetical protein
LQDLAKHYPQVELKQGSGIVLDWEMDVFKSFSFLWKLSQYFF